MGTFWDLWDLDSATDSMKSYSDSYSDSTTYALQYILRVVLEPDTIIHHMRQYHAYWDRYYGHTIENVYHMHEWSASNTYYDGRSTVPRSAGCDLKKLTAPNPIPGWAQR